MKEVISTKAKALSINLDTNIYGVFSEVGAGQEVVRHFFRAGGASGTIAEANSAYDKDFSDAIYGKEATGQYVCKPRLEKMIEHGYGLMLARLDRAKHPDKKFFAFANTMETINYERTSNGHGWIGIRYQSHPDRAPNDVIIHIRLHGTDAAVQQETIGLVGVNLVYSCFNYYKQPNEALLSLYDNIERHRMEIDMINLSGPDFKHIDNRLLSLNLVKNGMTDAVIFGPDGNNLHPSEVLYKKNILALRGSFRPVTKVSMDMINTGYSKFIQENRVEESNVLKLFEITLNNLKADGEIDQQDFLDRADLLCSLGQTVLVSNYQRYFKLVEYFSRYTSERMGIIIGIKTLEDIFDEKYYRKLNGGILEAFGILFTRDLKMYLYPFQPTPEDELLNSKNFKIPHRMQPLFNYLMASNRILDIDHHDPEVLHIFSTEVLQLINEGKSGWENTVPGEVDRIIKEKSLFGYREKKSVAKE